MVVSRVAANRVFYRQPPALPAGTQRPKGRPRWYGQRFCLKDPDTWNEPDEAYTGVYTSRGRRTYTLELLGWHDLLMRGKKHVPMHQYPFTLVQARLLDDQDQMVFQRPLLFVIFGSLGISVGGSIDSGIGPPLKSSK